MKLAVIDFETEMVGDYGDLVPRPIEIGIVLIDGYKILAEQEHWIYPDRPLLVRPPAHDLTGAQKAKVIEAEHWSNVHAQVINFVPPDYIPAAWSATFDRQVWETACARYKCSTYVNHHWFCLMLATWAFLAAIDRPFDMARNSLINAHDKMGIPFKHAHRALQDARAEANMFLLAKSSCLLEMKS